MDPTQVAQLLKLLETIAGKIGDKPYTITGAQDWPILLVLGGIIVGMVGFMWTDLRATIKDGRKDWKAELGKHEQEDGRQLDYVWAELRRCQADCCGRGAVVSDRRSTSRPARARDEIEGLEDDGQ